jgi:hypothetical protein
LRIDTSNCTVTMSEQGSRYSAQIALAPKPGTDYWPLVSTPGAVFAIQSGMNYGNAIEWVDCGRFYATAASREIAAGDLPLTLQDGTTWLDGTPFADLWSISDQAGRQASIAALVADANPLWTILQNGTEQLMGAASYSDDRLQAVIDLANGGAYDAAFDAIGEFVIRDMPILTPSVPVWTLVTGEQGVILPDSERQIPLDKMWNSVIVGTSEAFQTWGAVTVEISDPTHPWHSSKIGPRPFKILADATITTQAQMIGFAQATLQRLLTPVEQVQIAALGNPALEYGDTLAVAHSATEADPGLAANYFTQGWDLNLGTGAQDITGRSTSLPELDEAA